MPRGLRENYETSFDAARVARNCSVALVSCSFPVGAEPHATAQHARGRLNLLSADAARSPSPSPWPSVRDKNTSPTFEFASLYPACHTSPDMLSLTPPGKHALLFPKPSHRLLLSLALCYHDSSPPLGIHAIPLVLLPCFCQEQDDLR